MSYSDITGPGADPGPVLAAMALAPIPFAPSFAPYRPALLTPGAMQN